MRTTVDMWTYREGIEPRRVAQKRCRIRRGGDRRLDRQGRRGDTTGRLVVVDTGPWIFGKKVMLPAGVIGKVDYDEEKVFVNRSKDQIKNAPEFDDSVIADEQYRTNLGSYYGGPAH